MKFYDELLEFSIKREDQVSKIESVFSKVKEDNKHTLLNLWGLTGIGKHDVAIQFICRNIKNRNGKKANYNIISLYDEEMLKKSIRTSLNKELVNKVHLDIKEYINKFISAIKYTLDQYDKSKMEYYLILDDVRKRNLHVLEYMLTEIANFADMPSFNILIISNDKLNLDNEYGIADCCIDCFSSKNEKEVDEVVASFKDAISIDDDSLAKEFVIKVDLLYQKILMAVCFLSIPDLEEKEKTIEFLIQKLKDDDMDEIEGKTEDYLRTSYSNFGAGKIRNVKRYRAYNNLMQSILMYSQYKNVLYVCAMLGDDPIPHGYIKAYMEKIDAKTMTDDELKNHLISSSFFKKDKTISFEFAFNYAQYYSQLRTIMKRPIFLNIKCMQNDNCEDVLNVMCNLFLDALSYRIQDKSPENQKKDVEIKSALSKHLNVFIKNILQNQFEIEKITNLDILISLFINSYAQGDELNQLFELLQKIGDIQLKLPHAMHTIYFKLGDYDKCSYFNEFCRTFFKNTHANNSAHGYTKLVDACEKLMVIRRIFSFDGLASDSFDLCLTLPEHMRSKADHYYISDHRVTQINKVMHLWYNGKIDEAKEALNKINISPAKFNNNLNIEIRNIFLLLNTTSENIHVVKTFVTGFAEEIDQTNSGIVESPIFLNTIGLAYFLMKKTDEAETYFKAALARTNESKCKDSILYLRYKNEININLFLVLLFKHFNDIDNCENVNLKHYELLNTINNIIDISFSFLNKINAAENTTVYLCRQRLANLSKSIKDDEMINLNSLVKSMFAIDRKSVV